MALLLPPSGTSSKKISVNSSAISVRTGSAIGGTKASEKKISSSALLDSKKETSAIVKATKSSSISLNKIVNITQKDNKKDIAEYRKEKSEKIKEKDKKKKSETEKFLEAKTGIQMPKVSGIKLPSIQAPGFFQRFIDE